MFKLQCFNWFCKKRNNKSYRCDSIKTFSKMNALQTTGLHYVCLCTPMHTNYVDISFLNMVYIMQNNIMPVCKWIRFINKWERPNLFTLELHPNRNPFVKWKSFRHLLHCIISPFSIGLHLQQWKGPQSVQWDPLYSCFLVTSAKQAVWAATQTRPITFQFEDRGLDGMKGRWIDSLDGSENEGCYMH